MLLKKNILHIGSKRLKILPCFIGHNDNFLSCATRATAVSIKDTLVVLGPSSQEAVGGEIAGHYFQAKVPERIEGDLCLGEGALRCRRSGPV